MLIRTTMALALILASASGSLAAEKRHSNDPAYRAFASEQAAQPQAAQKRQHSSNPANDVYDIRGQYVGSDPDPTVRAQLARDRSSD